MKSMSSEEYEQMLADAERQRLANQTAVEDEQRRADLLAKALRQSGNSSQSLTAHNPLLDLLNPISPLSPLNPFW